MARVRPETAETTATSSRPVASPGMIVPSRDEAPAPTALARRKSREAEIAAPRGKGSAKRRRDAPAAPPANPQLAQGMLIGALAGCGFTMVALATWSPADPSLSVSSSGPVANMGGPLGAYLADLMYQGLGWGAWSVLVVAAWLILRLAGRVAGSAWNFVLGGFATWMLSTGFDLALGHEATRAFPPGGLVGILSANVLRESVGPAGAALAVGTGILLATTLLFGINWQPLAAGTVDRVQAGVPRAGRLLGAAAGAAGRGALAVGSRAGEALRTRLRRDDEGDDEIDDDGDVGEELAVPPTATVPAPTASPPGTLRPALPVTAGPAVERPPGTTRAGSRSPEMDVVAPVEDLPSMHASVWSARPAPAPRVRLDAPAPDRPTEVSGRTLVEAAWEEDRSAPAAHAASAYDVPLPRHATPPASVRAPIDDIGSIDDIDDLP
ncbi:MAG: DNA translocase FtsK 4TM domain-containing protein, partial [Deltaproteobacteria bacterium]|nr:DNA translocase FtsK 4TM domain-containing protein [Deltaproteobacteria bacterium]